MDSCTPLQYGLQVQIDAMPHDATIESQELNQHSMNVEHDWKVLGCPAGT